MKLKIEVDMPGITGDQFKNMRGAAWDLESLARVFYSLEDDSIEAEHISVQEIDDEDVNPAPEEEFVGDDDHAYLETEGHPAPEDEDSTATAHETTAQRTFREDQDAPLDGDAL